MGKTLSENNLTKLIETIKSNSDSLYVSKSSQNSNEMQTDIDKLTNIASAINARMVCINRAKLITDESVNIPNEYTNLVKINDHKIDITLNDENREVSFYFSTHDTLYAGLIYQLMYNISSSNELETEYNYSNENSKIHMSLDSIERPTDNVDYDYNAIHKGVNYFDIMVSKKVNTLVKTNSIKISFSLRRHITEEIKFSISNLFVCIDEITTSYYLTLLKSNQLQNMDLLYTPISTHYDIAPEDKMILFEELKPKKTSGHVNESAELFPIFFAPRVFGRYSDSYNISMFENYKLYGDYGLESNNVRPLSVDDVTNIENLDVSKFQNLSFVFYNCDYHDNDLDLTGWDVSNVKIASGFFSNCNFRDVDLSNWDTRNFEDIRGMFASKISNMYFQNYFHSLKLDNWNVSNIDSMDYLFCNICVSELDLSTWDMSHVSSFRNMFYRVSKNSVKLEKLIWGGAINACPTYSDNSNVTCSLDLFYTILTPENAELFFNSLSAKTISGEVVIRMPSTAQGADISIATEKGYTITGITAP